MRKLIIDGRCGVLLASLVFFGLLYPLTKPFPYTDDWAFLPYLLDARHPDMWWLFALHNDHRIPLQKILYLVLMTISGGDFRVMIGANVCVIAATALLWVQMARQLTSSSSWSEWLVPGVLLGLGFNTVAWGFSFQFLSGLFFLAAANVLWLRSLRADPRYLGGAAFLALTLCAWCGGNGLITATVVGAGFLCGVAYRGAWRLLSIGAMVAVALWVATVATIWLRWQGSAATAASGHDLGIYVRFAYEMSKSWFGVYAAQHPAISGAGGALVMLVGLLGSLFWLVKHRPQGGDNLAFLRMLPVFLAALQTAVMVALISVSRAAAQPWFPGLELHYGYLVTALPLCAWLVILMIPGAALRHTLLAALIVLVGMAYSGNVLWRLDAAKTEYHDSSAVVADLVSPMPAEDVAHRHIRAFYWVDGKDAEAAVTAGIQRLRELPFWAPAPQK